MGIKQKFETAKQEAKNEIKKIAKKLAKKILITVGPYILIVVLIAGCFFVIEEKLKDIAGEVVKAASKITSIFDNTSDTPAVIINDELLEKVKEEMKNEAIDIDESYLTDALLKASLEAYYATQYPYIEGVDYGDENEDEVSNVIKGAIYLKRENMDMQYINYGSFTSMMGDGKSTSDKDNIKMKFSVDNDGNIVVATWSMTNTVTETKQEDGSYSQDGSETSTSYSISEYKIDQKTLTEQYTMSYKLPILLGNMYSNEGFGVAVAKLGRNAKIELSILDDTSETRTVSREFLKENYKTSGTYSWRDMEDDPLKTDNFEGVEWANDYTSENTAYKVTTETSESNNITIKTTAVDTWTVKGEVTDISANTNTNTDSNETEMENDSDYKEDTTTTVSQDQIDKIKENIMNNKVEGSEGPMTVNSIESVDAKVYKKLTDHKVKTDTTTTTTTYTSSDMQLTDNTDKFLALIKADSNGNYSKDGKLVEYIRKGIDVKKVDISDFNNVTSSGTTSNLSGIQGKIADFLLGKGMPIEGVAAVLGNIEIESTFRNNEVYAGHYGLIQWSDERFENLQKLAKKNGKDWTDVDSQLEYMWSELCGNYAPVKKNLMAAKNVNSATDFFRLNYEKCGEQGAQDRRDAANKWYKELKKKVTQTAESGKESSSGGTYEYGGKTYHNYKQYDYISIPPYYNATGTWGNIKEKGCMPSSLSIIASGYGKKSKNGNLYNPKTFVEEVLPGKGGKQEGGSAFSTYSNIVNACKKIGLKAGSQKYTSSSSAKSDMLNHLKKGNPIIIHASAGYYTGGGHFMTLLGCDGNKVYLSNPGSSSKHGMIDINTLISRNVDWYCLISN